ncbi:MULTISPECIES: GNAT family N-acetyltransferase [unclassified Pseudomonas]|uniref:GNAT family N-acetyltransferase n=1 Tax=unclassified Pseudomonas TaxID=196821 RepID=UPI00244D6A7A|nr:MULTISPECIES: GNAT family N-acetyltransferase [unclassified Pseudomonas]MDG9930909.1 GNAT family N-acetyltransferase [Pseudomonas sp. GD04042]MDH0481041.1 GNAT family N-acetyltransferase [Pseudomonas sp. GD04015]MDH0604377.1 GNAT family N-acetyltransferase [Pseudomonas sp. GD03869]
MQIELVRTTVEQLPLIANLYQYYAYESSDWEEEEVEPDGRFYLHEPHLVRYWQEPEWSAELILADGFIAGFLLIERSELAGIDALEFADLFILRKYRRQGIGRLLTQQVLNRGGTWLVRLYPQDEPAMAFWRSIQAELPLGSRQVWPDDDPELVSYLINPPLH